MKTLVGVILGYLVMFVTLFVLLSALYAALGPDGVFLPKSYTPSAGWIIFMQVGQMVAALAAGYVAYKLGGLKSGIWLASLVLIFGVASVLVTLGQPAAEAREGQVAVFDAMAKARTPAWASLLQVAIGVVSVLFGVKLAPTDAPK
ncbi:MAG: hypothetical protein SFX74_06500 [Fimbriimonadaceae bacterium]|nr:hypothetical protein [Fimbriimonadaceae bacterium]